MPGGFPLAGFPCLDELSPADFDDRRPESDDPENRLVSDEEDHDRAGHESGEPASGPTTVTLPNGETLTAASPQLAAAIEAAAGGTPIAEAFRQEGMTIPPPGTAVSDPVDPSQLTPGDIGMFTDRHALALGESRALVNGQIQHISTVNGPGFLGWEHPPAPVNAPAPNASRTAGADPAGERRENRDSVEVVRLAPATSEGEIGWQTESTWCPPTCVKPPATTKRRRSICAPCRRRTRRFSRAWIRWARSSAN